MQKEMEKVRKDLEAAKLAQGAKESGSGAAGSGSGSRPMDQDEEDEEDLDYRLSDESIEDSDDYDDMEHRAK